MDTPATNAEPQSSLDPLASRVITTAKGPVEFSEAGKGLPILYFHGSGGAGDLVFEFERPLLEAGFRLIVPSRPGYGKTPLEGNRSAADCADLAAELLSALGVDQVSVMGCSGGGPFATAFAVRHGMRTASLVLQCAQVHRWDERRWLGPGNRWTFPLLARPSLRRWLLWSYRWQLAFASPRKFLKFESGSRYAEVRHDPRACQLAKLALESLRTCLAQSEGFGNDFAVFLGEDVLRPGAVACPTLVIHDPLDPVAPIDHAHWVTACVSHAELSVAQVGGHFIWVGKDADEMHRRRVEFLRQHIA